MQESTATEAGGDKEQVPETLTEIKKLAGEIRDLAPMLAGDEADLTASTTRPTEQIISRVITNGGVSTDLVVCATLKKNKLSDGGR